MKADKVNRRDAPPVAAWAVSACMASLLLFGSHHLMKTEIEELREEERETLRDTFNIKRLEPYLEGRSAGGEERGSTETKRPLVVAFGSSLTEAALPFDPYFEHNARTRGLGEIGFIRFCRVAFNPEDFFYLLDDLLSARPAVLILEMSTFMFFDHGGLSVQLDRNRTQYREMLLRAIGLEHAAEDDDEEELTDEQKKRIDINRKHSRLVNRQDHLIFVTRNLDFVSEQSDEDLKSLIKSRIDIWRGCNLSIPGAFDEFLERAREQGTEIVLLDISGSREGVEVFPAELRQCAARLADKYRDAYGAHFMEFPKTLALDYYRDFVHLNKKGRLVFVNWIVEELKKIMPGAG